MNVLLCYQIQRKSSTNKIPFLFTLHNNMHIRRRSYKTIKISINKVHFIFLFLPLKL